MNDINQVQGVAVVFSILFSTVWNIALSANVAFGLNPSLMVLFLGLIPIEILITGRKGNFERRWIQALNNRMGKHYQVMTEILDKVKHIKVFNGVHAALQQFSNSLQVHHPFSFPALFLFVLFIFFMLLRPPLQLNHRIIAYTFYATNFGFDLILSLYQNVFQFSLMYLLLPLPRCKTVTLVQVHQRAYDAASSAKRAFR